jgi:hypothetical protein
MHWRKKSVEVPQVRWTGSRSSLSTNVRGSAPLCGSTPSLWACARLPSTRMSGPTRVTHGPALWVVASPAEDI